MATKEKIKNICFEIENGKTTQKAETERLTIRGQPGQKVHENSCPPIKNWA
jgi:hypothetical protein